MFDPDLRRPSTGLGVKRHQCHPLGFGQSKWTSKVNRLNNQCPIYIVFQWVFLLFFFRLKGHKGPVTSVTFMRSRSESVLVTSSKDSLIKFWDLDTFQCFQTLTGHLGEVWDFELVKEDKYLVSGSSDSELRVFKLNFDDSKVKAPLEPNLKKLKLVEDEMDEKEDLESILKIEKMGSILRQGQDKVMHLTSDSTNRLMLCHGSNDYTVELFLICNEEEVKKRCQKKVKKAKKRGQDDETSGPTIQEEFRRLKSIKCGGKVRSIDVKITKSVAQFTILTSNNLLEMYDLDLEDKNSEVKLIKRLDHEGHRSDVRTTSFSNDNSAILTGSQESVKLWNRNSKVCIRTIQTGYCLSSLFVPGDRQAVIGTKSGSILIIDLDRAEVIEEVSSAHSKEVWSLSIFSNQKGFVSASEDKTVKFWQFELVETENSPTKVLSIVHMKTLELDEGALACKLSADGRLLSVSLLDNTIKVFFVDSLKFFLSLYGHHQAALAVDISTDSTLIATGGGDRNIKIWGLDFGDCHKSLLAHEDSVTDIKFIVNTHMFFSAGRDGVIKQWDADNFNR